MTLDDSFDEEDDLKLDVEGLTVVIERAMQDALENATISIDPNQGVIVSCPSL